jgi:uncharacterized repeat protein (TIGR01451 family)
MTCDVAAQSTRCSAARNDTSAPATSANSALNNNTHSMVEVDVDSDLTTTNSSTAALAMPAGASVLWAGLYWMASAPKGITESQGKSAKLRGPLDLGYRSIAASQYDPSPASYYGYSSFADVTDIVKEQGAGSWTLGGIPIAAGTGNGAGWSLVVAYSAPGMAVRDLAVFDGQTTVGGTNMVSIPISGFRTPSSGAVKSDVGFVAFEGDRGVIGDYLQLDATVLTDALHPATNTFNSWITDSGRATAGRNPSYGNQLGFDAAIMKADGVLKNNATSAELRAKTTGDGYMPTVFTFSTELYAPLVSATKTAVDLNGGELRVGDEIGYEITTSNSGGDGAVGAAVREDSMPGGTEYVPSSMSYDDGTGYKSLTDASGDDEGDAAGGTGPVDVRIGQSASGLIGGLMPGALATSIRYRVKFRAKVVSLPPAGGLISNKARVDFAAQTLGSHIETDTNRADLAVRLPDAAIKKTISSSDFANGLPAAYTLVVTNRGDAPFEGETVVTDELPAGLVSPAVTSSPGWSCSIAASKLECRRSDALATGLPYPPIVVGAASLSNPAGDLIENTATVSTPLDPDSSNDSSTASKQVGVGQSTVPVAVAADRAAVLPGESVVFTGSYYNRGPSRAESPNLKLAVTGLTGADVVATGFTVLSSDGSITAADCKLTQSDSTPPTVTCADKALANGVTVEIKLTLVPRIAITAADVDVRGTSSASNDPGGPRSAQASVDIIPTIDLDVTKTASRPTLDPGDSVTFTIHVVNNGPAAATGARIIDVVPADLTVVSADFALDGNPSTLPCSITGQKVECALTGTLAAPSGSGAKFADVTVVARSDKDGHGLRTNRAGADAREPDVFPDNNVSSADVTLLPAADLSISKIGPASLAPGGVGTFQMVVTNAGPSDAADVQLSDRLPAGLSLDPNSPVPPGCISLAPPLVVEARLDCTLKNDTTAGFPLGTLAPGEKWVVTLKAVAAKSLKPGAILVNSASATTSTFDPTPANATDQVKVVVASISQAKKQLAVSIKAPRASTPVGSRLNLVVKVTAPKAAAVANVELCAALPRSIRYLSSTGKLSGSTVCWRIKLLRAAQTRSFTIRARVLLAGRMPALARAVGSGAARVTDGDQVRTHSFTG